VEVGEKEFYKSMLYEILSSSMAKKMFRTAFGTSVVMKQAKKGEAIASL
tara:strand:- start:4945 stop:5091 length:147 start_codon:yes stop_codon:yes gene_type:complete